MKTVIITGATGFIGMAVSQKLLETGCIVYGVGRNETKLHKLDSYPNYIPILIDSSTPFFVEKIPSKSIDVLFHFAWDGGYMQNALKDDSLQISNIQMSCDVIKQAVELGVKKFIYAGTVNEVEIHQSLNEYDNFQMRPTCIYAASKLAAELICKTIAQEHHMQFCSGLIPMLYGPGNLSKQVVNVVIESLLCHETPKLIKGDNLYDIVHIDDVASAFAAIAEKGKDRKSVV